MKRAQKRRAVVTNQKDQDSRQVTVSAKSVEEAIEQGLADLGISRDQADVDVEKDAKEGFLGIGGQDAVVVVTAKSGPSKKDRGKRGSRSGDSRKRGNRAKKSSASEDDRGNLSVQDEQNSTEDDSAPAERPEIVGVSQDDEIPIPGSPQELPLQPSGEYDDEVDEAGSTLRDVLTLLGFTGTEITMSEAEDSTNDRGRRDVTLEVDATDEESADNIGVLIGKRGDTLSSLQYLLNTIVGKGKQGSPIFSVDIEGYRLRHHDRLRELAEEVANDVSETGDIIELKPMSAGDRRIIHLSLQDRSDIVTQSIGRGRDRRIEVLPATSDDQPDEDSDEEFVDDED
jgi:spoIIIJ-associated protein